MKDIPLYENIYAITQNGKVWSYLSNKFLVWRWKPYLRVMLYKDCRAKNFSIHRLVALTYLLNTENKPQINHINWIKTDNRVENLEWCTWKENTQHGWSDLWRKVSAKLLEIKSKKVMQLTKEWVLCKVYNSAREAGRINWFSQWNISACATWKLKTCWWYFWKYITL